MTEKTKQGLNQLRPADLLVLAIWFGVLTGLGELAVLAARKFILGHLVWRGLDVLWMAPLVTAAVFALVGLVLYSLSLRWRIVAYLPVAVFVYCFLGFSTALLLYGPLHNLAVVLLALGMASVASRIASAYPRLILALLHLGTGSVGGAVRRNEFLPSRRRFLLSSGAAVTLLAVGAQGWPQLVEARSLQALPQARSKMPNVLLIVMDTVRAKSLSLHGYERRTTPNLEALAQSGVVFDRAVSTASWTLPSHASMFTGRSPHEMSADWKTPLDGTHPTLAEVLRGHGYLTGGFVANTLYCGYETGLDSGFTRYEDYPVSMSEMARSSTLVRETVTSSWVRNAFDNYEMLGRKRAEVINDQFLRWLSGRDAQRPFFAFLNYFDAHNPYLPPEPFDTMFGPRRPWRDPRLFPSRQWSPKEVQAEQDAYEGAIAYLDHHLGELFAALRRQGVLEDTLVIVTSDHGEQFGEHNLMGHGTSLYWPLIHVPLVVSFPGRTASGVRVAQSVSLQDISATVLDQLGLEGVLPGETLGRFWNGGGATIAGSAPTLSELGVTPEDVPERFPIAKGDMKSLVLDRYHYIRNGDGGEELYDVEDDPGETRNLVNAAEVSRILDRMRGSMDTMLARGTTGHLA